MINEIELIKPLSVSGILKMLSLMPDNSEAV